MIVAGVSREQLEKAIRMASCHYKGNLKLKDIRPLNTCHDRWRFTITVKSSKGPGASWDPIHDRRIAAACWHAHREVFQQVFRLAPKACITTCHGKLYHGTPFEDWNAGSILCPVMASERCHCNEH